MTANFVPDKPYAPRSLKRRAIFGLLTAAAVAAATISTAPLSMAWAAAPDSAPDSVTHHQFKVGDRPVDFTVTAATLPLNDDKGERRAGLFHVAYTRDGADPNRRPITFVFNGGPGASSAYLHLGALGPRIVPFGPDGQMPEPAAKLVDNPYHWLDLSDLVFVDPVGTGYSRPVGEGKRYWGVSEDLESLAGFIDRYLTLNNRRASPKYLVGESYGGFRSARLPEVLAENHSVTIDGVFLVSPVLEFSLIGGDALALLPDVLRLPSYAAVRLEQSGTLKPAALAEVEKFALGPYLTALAATPRDEAALRAIYPEVARFTGVPEPVIAQNDGRVPLGLFVKEARRPDKLLISRYDGSATAPDPYPESNRARGDAYYDNLRSVLANAMTDYLSQSLGVQTDLRYHLINNQVVRQWNWRSGIGGREGYAGAADSLREVLAGNRAFKVAVAHGMTDLVTPYMTSRYVLDHLPASLTSGRVTFGLHPGGHMMYLRAASRAGLHADAARLYPAPE
jgi:carboxypeptidase C (cathepsin A)